MTGALVVGYGSAGRRHVRLLEELGCDVTVVSRRAIPHDPHYSSIGEALASTSPGYAVVANETSAHFASIEELAKAGFRGRLLVEKPLGGIRICHASFEQVAVGYNLRFHPVIAALAETLSTERIVAAQVYCGQYLPDWRPGTDYRAAYSANAALGGGVLRDLSHELDYLQWLFGPWRRVAALGGRSGALDIASDDNWALLLELERCPSATVQINYLDRPGRREMVVNTAGHTYVADLMAGTLGSDGDVRSFPYDVDETYRAQHRAMLSGDASRRCSVAEGERVMALIAAVELAVAEGRWVEAAEI